ncbi:hypothetical protein RND81_13G101200 [Saponaria officinalis]|uniref:Reverse transcriptase zinc-binding domain-containing protein n=1 Tax=Saponaria officinalis TaxID=3572 RepID=A0AAW1H5J3_SAPOF
MYGLLLAKIQNSVQHWSSKILSYAGKIQLLNSVIFGLESYWCACILLPKGVIKQIRKICKDFFWNQNGGKRWVFKSWKSICHPWREGGFGIKELLSWNKALLARLLWKLDQGVDSVWVQWTTEYNLCGQSVWEVSVKNFHSESFRGILVVRDDFLQKTGSIDSARARLASWVNNKKFNLSKAYDFFRLKSPTITWTKSIMGSSVVPSHGVITMIAGQGKLATTDSISRRGLILVNRYSMCECHEETHRHLFFRCPMSHFIWLGLTAWMRIASRSCDLLTELHWTIKRNTIRHWKTRWFRGCVTAAVYYILHERNTRIFAGQKRSPSQILWLIKYIVSIRLISCTSRVDEHDITSALNQ